VKPRARQAGAEPASLARASHTGMPRRGVRRALDDLCNPVDPLAPGNCYVVYIGRFHSPSAGPGHCCSADPSDSGPAASLRPGNGVSEAPGIYSHTSPRTTSTRQKGAVIKFRADRIDGPSVLRIPQKARQRPSHRVPPCGGKLRAPGARLHRIPDEVTGCAGWTVLGA
jgi:hypothetical protein